MDLGIVDVHAHYTSPRALATLGTPRDRGVPAGLDDLDRRTEWMRGCGIALQMLGPELGYADPDLGVRDAVRRSRLVNETTAEDVCDRPAFVPLAMVPLQSGELAASALEHAVSELGFRGAMIPSRVQGGLASRRLNPFWECAHRLDVPVVVHSGAPPVDTRLTVYGLEGQVGRPQEVALAAISLIFGGVLDRFPSLRIVLAMGGGNLPQLMPRLDRLHEVDGDGARLEATPSAYLRRLYYDALVFGVSQLRLLVEQVGAERVMVGTDWPFPVFDKDPATSVSSGVDSEEARKRILRTNAREVFGLVEVAR